MRKMKAPGKGKQAALGEEADHLGDCHGVEKDRTPRDLTPKS